MHKIAATSRGGIRLSTRDYSWIAYKADISKRGRRRTSNAFQSISGTNPFFFAYEGYVYNLIHKIWLGCFVTGCLDYGLLLKAIDS